MKKKKMRYVIVFALACVSGAMLLQTSQDVQRAEEEMTAMQVAVQSEKDSIRVLQTEWDYLNNPERLETLAAQYLDVNAPAAGQVISTPASLPDPFVPASATQSPANENSSPSSLLHPAALIIPASQENPNALALTKGGRE